MSVTVYILYTQSINKYYRGITSDLEARLHRHNMKYEKWTSKGVPWTVIWKKDFNTRDEAIRLENKLKNQGKR